MINLGKLARKAVDSKFFPFRSVFFAEALSPEVRDITSRNHAALTKGLETLKGTIPSAPQVLLLSPSCYDAGLIGGVLPESDIFVANIQDWDLNCPCPVDGRFDLIVASNVFHYSPDPELWFRHALSATRFLAIQDLVVRRRSAAPDGLCDDGDRVRYSFESRDVRSTFPKPFNLDSLDLSVTHFETFEGGRNQYHPAGADAPIHWCGVFQSGKDLGHAAPKHGTGKRGVMKTNWMRLLARYNRSVTASGR